jgi:predicted NUDIX family phosphoesterase
MGKTAIQTQAERLAEQFRASKRPPLVVEFAGVPKAGKTSTLNHVYSFLRRCGFKCEVVVERASVCPIRDKRHFNFNIWTACTTLSQLLEKTQNPPRENDPDILFLDRGVFDAICWLSLLEKLSRITPPDMQKADDFFLIDDWTARVSGVVAMSTSPTDALKREQGLLPVEGSGGSIMNPTVLKQMGAVIKEKTAELQGQFRIFPVDTSSKKYRDKPQVTCEDVAHKILFWIKESIEEKILSAPKSTFQDLQNTFVASASEASQLIAKFETQGDFLPRKRVEADLSRVQPLPIVVVRNRSGHILRLVRKEREPSNKLHKKITIWAGGHVRREDGPKGTGSIVGAAIRELHEELRIYAQTDRLILLGAVYVPSSGSTKKHMAFVYEWKATTDDVQVALCNGEFMERTGTSLQGTFLSPEKIIEESQELEEWSHEILNNLLLVKPQGAGEVSANT